MNLAPYRKAVIATIGAILTWGATAHLPDGSIDRAEWWGLAIAVATALGVYGVANEPAPTADERGGVEPGSLALGILVGVILGFLLWASR